MKLFFEVINDGWRLLFCFLFGFDELRFGWQMEFMVSDVIEMKTRRNGIFEVMIFFEVKIFLRL